MAHRLFGVSARFEPEEFEFENTQFGESTPVNRVQSYVKLSLTRFMSNIDAKSRGPQSRLQRFNPPVLTPSLRLNPMGCSFACTPVFHSPFHRHQILEEVRYYFDAIFGA